MARDQAPDYVAPWVRMALLLSALAAAAGLSLYATGSLVPQDREQALIFQSGLLLVVLGSTVLEDKFTKPADSAINALTGIIALATVFTVAPKPGWWLAFLYCIVTFALALVCIAVSTGPTITGKRARIANFTFGPAVLLGRARLLQSVVFLFGVFAFYQTGSTQAAILVAFWGVFVALWPLRIPQALTRLGQTRWSSAPQLSPSSPAGRSTAAWVSRRPRDRPCR